MSTFNDNRAYGFAPWGPILRVHAYEKKGYDSQVAYIGDMMGLSGTTGFVTASAAGSTLLLGANLTYSATATTGTVRIADDPDQLFHCQDNTAGTLTQADVGDNADFVFGAGSAYTKLSGSTLNTQTALGVTAAGFKLLGLLPNFNTGGNEGPNVFGKYCKVVVQLNESALATNSGGGA